MSNLENSELEIRKKLARNEKTSSEALTDLSNDVNSEVRLLVASNPNTHVQTLLKLGEEFPDAITANPIFDLLLLENQNSHFIKLSLARSSTTSKETLTKLSETKYYYHERAICEAIACNPNTPVSVLEKLSTWFPISEENSEPNDGDRVIGGVASNPNTPLHILEKLANNCSGYVRKKVATNKNAPANLLEKLARDRYSYVLLAVANNVNTPLSITQKILEYLAGELDYQIRSAVLKHPHITDVATKTAKFVSGEFEVSQSLLKKLAKDPRQHIRNLIVTNPDTSAEILDILIEDPNPNLCFKVVYHKNTSSQALENISENPSLWLIEAYKFTSNKYTAIAKALIRHPNTTSKVLDNIASVESFSIQPEIFSSPLLSSKALDVFVNRILNKEDTYILNKSPFSRHKNLSSKSLEKIYLYFKNKANSDNDIWSIFNEALIEHPNFPVSALEELANNKKAIIRGAVAINPNTPIHVLRKLSFDNGKYDNSKYYDQTIVGDVALNISTPLDILINFTYNKNPSIKEKVARNINLSSVELERLAKDEDMFVRRSVAANINTPINTLVKLANDKYKDVKIGVVKNKNTPVEILEKLFKDSNMSEYALVFTSNPNTPDSILSKFILSETNKVKYNIARHSKSSSATLLRLAKNNHHGIKRYILERKNISESLREEVTKLLEEEEEKITNTKQRKKEWPAIPF